MIDETLETKPAIPAADLTGEKPATGLTQEAIDAAAAAKVPDNTVSKDAKLPNETPAADPVAPAAADPVVAAAAAAFKTDETIAAQAQEQAKSDTVKMLFPHPILLTIRHGFEIQFQKGVQDVPVEHAENPYLVKQGVVPLTVAEDEKIG